MKYFLMTFVLFNNVRCAPADVYICDSQNAIRYHLRQNCRGLSNCSHRIIKTSLEEAQKKKLTLCKLEQ